MQVKAQESHDRDSPVLRWLENISLRVGRIIVTTTGIVDTVDQQERANKMKLGKWGRANSLDWSATGSQSWSVLLWESNLQWLAGPKPRSGPFDF